VNQVNAALDANSNAQAFADARAAASSDPLSYEPHFLLAQLYRSANDDAAARAELVRATQIQPQNPATWLQLGNLQLQTGDLPQAIASMNRVGLLDRTPDSTVRTAVSVIDRARAAITRAKAAAAKRSATPVSSRRRSRDRARASK
jgi:Tfp pilus assembly protein PilF